MDFNGKINIRIRLKIFSLISILTLRDPQPISMGCSFSDERHIKKYFRKTIAFIRGFSKAVMSKIAFF